MIDDLLRLWVPSAPTVAASLYSGSDHCGRIAGRLRERGSCFIHVSIPLSHSPH